MAIPNEQAMEASRTGGVLTPASKNPNSPEYVQYAGFLSSLLKPSNLKTVIDALIENSVTSGKRFPEVTLFSIRASITVLRLLGFKRELKKPAYWTYSGLFGFLDAGVNTPPVREASIACSLGIAINFP